MGHIKTLAVVLLLASTAVAQTTQPVPDDNSAIRKRLTAVLAENATMAARIKVLEAEIAALKGQLAKVEPVAKTATTDEQLHALAAKLELHVNGAADVKKIMGEPFRELREGKGTALYYKADKLMVRCFIGEDWTLASVTERPAAE